MSDLNCERVGWQWRWKPPHELSKCWCDPHPHLSEEAVAADGRFEVRILYAVSYSRPPMEMSADLLDLVRTAETILYDQSQEASLDVGRTVQPTLQLATFCRALEAPPNCYAARNGEGRCAHFCGAMQCQEAQ